MQYSEGCILHVELHAGTRSMYYDLKRFLDSEE